MTPDALRPKEQLSRLRRLITGSIPFTNLIYTNVIVDNMGDHEWMGQWTNARCPLNNIRVIRALGIH